MFTHRPGTARMSADVSVTHRHAEPMGGVSEHDAMTTGRSLAAATAAIQTLFRL
jgi:hypothetical protein